MNSQSNIRRILITGGTGFIGTHLVNALVTQFPDAKLVVVDDLSTSNFPLERQKFFAAHGIDFHEMTVAEFPTPANVRYDEIYHLACKVGPALVPEYAGDMADEIIGDAKKMAQLALRDGAKMVTVSTSEVYGKDPNGKPQHENLALEVAAQTTARQEYSVAKLLMEIFLKNLVHRRGLRFEAIRPFNVVGRYQTKEGGYVVPRFVESAVRGEALTVFGDGSQVRSFTHVSDVTAALMLIMRSPEANGRIYNVGNPLNTCSVECLARRVIDIADSPSTISHVDPKTIFGPDYAEAPSKIPDIERITSHLGWHPRWNLDGIIEDYVAFVRGEDATISAAA